MKKTWLVRGFVHATTSRTVNAISAAEAMEKADVSASICHQCSDDLELGDVYATEVADPDARYDIVLKSEEHPDNDVEALNDLRALAKHLSGKRLPATIEAIVDKWSK